MLIFHAHDHLVRLVNRDEFLGSDALLHSIETKWALDLIVDQGRRSQTYNTYHCSYQSNLEKKVIQKSIIIRHKNLDLRHVLFILTT